MLYPNQPEVPWITIVKVYPPQDLIISSVLQSYGIPFRTRRREVSQLPVSIGPMAEVEILVPQNQVEEARALLEQTVEESVRE